MRIQEKVERRVFNHVEGAPEGRRYGFFEVFGMMTAIAIEIVSLEVV